MAVTVAAGCLPSGSTEPSPSTSAIAAPSVSTTPSVAPSMTAACDESAHADGVLVLRLEHVADTGRDWVISVFEDERILTPGPGPYEYTDDAWMIVRRLTQDGADALVNEAIDTGLFEESATYTPVSLPGVEPPGRGAPGYTVTLLRDGEYVEVVWRSMFDGDEAYYEPSPEIEQLDALGARLVDLDAWLPDEAWTMTDTCVYMAQEYEVIALEPQPWGGAVEDLPVDVADLEWPLGGDFLNWGEPFSNPGSDPNIDGRCGVVSRAEAIDLVESLVAQGAEPPTDAAALDESRYVSLMLGDAAAVQFYEVSLESLMPDAPRDCSDPNTPFFSPV